MKKFNIFSFLSILMLLSVTTGCQKDDIIFDIELPRFETRPGYQLLEVIVPQATMPTDKIYITGPFNGGEEAVGNPLWQLEKAQDTNGKWGIYLDPKDFIDGKTLADGYTFVSIEQGEERSAQNQPVVHRDAPKIGGRLNVLVEQWADGFITPPNPDDIVHDGYVIYVVDHSGYDALALYAWGDAEIFGGWPGIEPTGHVTIGSVKYAYFDTGASNEGLTENLIFNNNGGGQQLADYNVTLDQDYYLELTPDGVVPFDPSSSIEHDGFTVYVSDLSGWDSLYLYMWGTVNDLNGAWPGMAPTGKTTINGVTYTYFDLGAANCDGSLEEHVILNNGNGKQIDDVVVFNLDRDVYVELTSSSAKEIDPETYQPSTVVPDPEPDPEPENDYYLYIQDLTGWAAFNVYAWGDKELFGGWPGASASSTKEINGVTYLVFPFTGNGQGANLIFNDGDGTQYDAVGITADKDYYIVAYPDRAEIVTADNQRIKRTKRKAK